MNRRLWTNERFRTRVILVAPFVLILAVAVAGIVSHCREARRRSEDLPPWSVLHARIVSSAPLPDPYDRRAITREGASRLLHDYPPFRTWLLDLLLNSREKYRVREGAAECLLGAQDADTQREVLTVLVAWVRQTGRGVKRDDLRRSLVNSVADALMLSHLSDSECLFLLEKLWGYDVLRRSLEGAIALSPNEAERMVYRRSTWERVLARSKSLLTLLHEQERARVSGGAADATKAP
jgi:hypothetical protein